MSESRPERPEALAFKPEGVPETLRDEDQWVAWRYKWDRDRDEWTKIPTDVNTGDFASSTDSDTWGSFSDAVAYHNDSATDTDGVGFVVSDEDVFVGLDLDDCRDPESGDVEAWAREIVDDADTYAEWSPSGTGARAFGLGFMPDGKTRSGVDGAEGHIEMYETGRYLTVTGHKIDTAADDVERFDDEIHAIHAEHIAETPDTERNGHAEPDPEPADRGGSGGGTDLSDAELVKKAKSAENGDKFERLWNGRTTGYQSHSEARMAFANLLAFWTGGDEKRMLDLFKRSDLFRGDDDERTWTGYEAPKAVANTTEYYDPSERPESPDVPDAESDESGATLSPPGIMEKAFSDPYGRLSRDPDGENPTIHDLRNAEAASYLWDVIEDRGEVDVMAVSDGSLREYDAGIWKRGAGEQRLRTLGEQALHSAYSSKTLEQLKEKTRTRNFYDVDELGIDEPWLVANGDAVNLRTREQRPAGRDDLAIRSINAEYDPDAEPDLWIDFLSRVAATPETIDKVQEYFGYCLWVHGQPFGKGLFLIGDTDSGKGTALKVLSDILGKRENVSNESLQDLLETRWGKASLFGRMVNIRNEVTPGALNNVEDFKELLGGEDTVTAERKGEQKFEFTVRQKFAFATNQFPEIENADNAFWNRCLFARFPETIPEDEQRPGFHDHLLEERSGILNWMLDGLDRLFEQGGFTGERSFDEKRNIAEEVGSPLERLKQDALTITREPSDMVHARDLYDFAKAYADDVGMDSGIPAWKGGAFTSALREWPGIDKARTRKFDGSGEERAFRGVRVDQEVAHRVGVEVQQLDETPSGQTGLDV